MSGICKAGDEPFDITEDLRQRQCAYYFDPDAPAWAPDGDEAIARTNCRRCRRSFVVHRQMGDGRFICEEPFEDIQRARFYAWQVDQYAVILKSSRIVSIDIDRLHAAAEYMRVMISLVEKLPWKPSLKTWEIP